MEALLIATLIFTAIVIFLTGYCIYNSDRKENKIYNRKFQGVYRNNNNFFNTLLDITIENKGKSYNIESIKLKRAALKGNYDVNITYNTEGLVDKELNEGLLTSIYNYIDNIIVSEENDLFYMSMFIYITGLSHNIPYDNYHILNNIRRNGSEAINDYQSLYTYYFEKGNPHNEQPPEYIPSPPPYQIENKPLTNTDSTLCDKV